MVPSTLMGTNEDKSLTINGVYGWHPELEQTAIDPIPSLQYQITVSNQRSDMHIIAAGCSASLFRGSGRPRGTIAH